MRIHAKNAPTIFIRSAKLIAISITFALSSAFSVVLAPSSSQALTSGGEWKQVEAGGDFVCALSKIGQVYCRGMNYVGQLGDGTTNDSSSLKRVKGLLDGKVVTSIAAGGEHVCAVAEGETYCWGNNGNSQLGDGSTDPSSLPVKVTQQAGLLENAKVTVVSADWSESCAVADGSVFCWGSNTHGQLGDGTTTDSSVPVKVSQQVGMLQGKVVTSLTQSWDNVCAIAASEAFCWGSNTHGQLGDGTTTDSSVPVKVSQQVGMLQGREITSISAGDQHVCVAASEEAYCWGLNDNGQLGDGSINDSLLPSKVSQQVGALSGKTVKNVSSGDEYSCAVTDDGSYCWGVNSYGNLGTGNSDDSHIPMKVVLPQGIHVDTIVTSVWNYGIVTCSLGNGQIYCWGNNRVGAVSPEFGEAVTNTNSPRMMSHDSSGIFNNKVLTDISSGYYHTCAIADGAAYCWGSNQYGQLGNSVITSKSYVPQKVGGLLSDKTVTSIRATAYYTCAIADGEAYCWGKNTEGQLGDNTTNNSSTPVKVTQQVGALQGKVVAQIATSSYHACAIASGETYCWGDNYYGVLGDGTANSSSQPVKVVQDDGLLSGKIASQVAVGVRSSCALAEGKVYCWGVGQSGALGDGTGVDSYRPVSVVEDPGILAGKTVTSIAVNNDGYTVCAIADGETYCWGNNYYGEIGDGTSSNIRFRPVKVLQQADALGGKTVTGLSLGYQDACVIASGETYCWGYNYNGVFGDGTVNNSAVPVKTLQDEGVLLGQSISKISASFGHTCVLSSNGVICWGSNYDEQLGIPSQDLVLLPYMWTDVIPVFSGANGNIISDTSHPTLSKRPTFTGTAEPGSTIAVTVHSDPVTCTTTADSNGNWSCTLPSDLPPGNHTVLVEVTQNGDTTTFGPYNVTVATDSTPAISGSTKKAKSSQSADNELAYVATSDASDASTVTSTDDETAPGGTNESDYHDDGNQSPVGHISHHSSSPTLQVAAGGLVALALVVAGVWFVRRRQAV